jgi:uncharacterized protein YdaU (DUF1376 family)
MSEVKLPYFKYFTKDWEELTGALSIAERGAFQRLADHYWHNGSLTPDEVIIARIARATEREWETIGARVLGLFQFDKTTGTWRC